jgi:toxin ParE1/3/4
VKVVWTDTAVRHLQAIHDYILEDSETYARIVVDRITDRSRQLASHPLSGRRVPEYDADDVREVIEPPYRVIYRVAEDRVDVLGVIHGARQFLRRR